RRTVTVVGDTCNLDLVHCINHRRRRAVLPENLAQLGDLTDGETVAAVVGRNERAEELLASERVERFLRKTCVAVDRRSELCDDALCQPLDNTNNLLERAPWGGHLNPFLPMLFCTTELRYRDVRP